MVENMKENTKMIKKKVSVCLSSEMEESIKDNGKMVNNMVEVYSKRKIHPAKAYGNKAKE